MDSARDGGGGGGVDGRRQQLPGTTTSGVEGASYPMYPFAMVYQTTNPDQHQAVMTMSNAGGMTAGGSGVGSGDGISNNMGYYASQQQHQQQQQQQQQQQHVFEHGGGGGINFYDTMTTQSEGLEALIAAQEAVGPPSLAPQPIFVNPKQYERIMKRREARARLENHRKVVAERKPFLHKSRHEHAIKRPRGPGGRFLTKEERIAWDEEQARLEAPVTAAAKGGGGVGEEGDGEEGRRIHQNARTSKPSRAILAPQPVGIYPSAPEQQRQRRQHHPSHSHSSSSSSPASFSSSWDPVDKGLKQPTRS